MTEALDKLGALGIPTVPLKECVHDMGVLHSDLTGEKCPRCGGTEFWKRGSVNYKGQKFEDALKTFPEGDLSGISKVKRDVLWRRYQEIAIEIFVCEKTCSFSRTCKKDHHARKECSTVKKALKPKRVWKAEIII